MRTSLRFLATALLCIFFGPRLEARVFDITSEKFASYFLVNGGPSVIKQAAFLDEANVAYTYDKEIAYNYAGEFGFLYATQAVGFRFGFEVFKPQTLADISAANGGASVYSFKSDITGYAPKLGLEINLYKSGSSRAFLLAYTGTASISYRNDYANHTEEGKGTQTLYGGSVGFEGHLTDTTTYVFDVGYRTLNFDKINYTKDVASGIDGQAHAAGDPVLDVNGNQRHLDLTGLYLGVGFRFYL